MRIAACIVLIGSLALTAGCGTLDDMNLDANNPAVKQVVIAQAQHALAKEGMEVSADDLSVWYDALAAIPDLEALARQVEQNAVISNRASQVISEYLDAIQPEEEKPAPASE